MSEILHRVSKKGGKGGEVHLQEFVALILATVTTSRFSISAIALIVIAGSCNQYKLY